MQIDMHRHKYMGQSGERDKEFILLEIFSNVKIIFLVKTVLQCYIIKKTHFEIKEGKIGELGNVTYN